MTGYSIPLRDCKNISKNLTSKYSQKLLDQV